MLSFFYLIGNYIIYSEKIKIRNSTSLPPSQNHLPEKLVPNQRLLELLTKATIPFGETNINNLFIVEVFLPYDFRI